MLTLVYIYDAQAAILGTKDILRVDLLLLQESGNGSFSHIISHGASRFEVHPDEKRRSMLR